MGNENVVRFPHADRAAAHLGRRLIPGRLRDARKAKRMTQEELGSISGVTRQAISAFEAGAKSPDPNTFAKIAAAVEQPFSFFTSEDRPKFGQSGPRFFRKAGPETVRRNDACSVLGDWFVQSVRYLDNYINYPLVDLPNATASSPTGRYTPDEIEGAASDCRKQWELGLGPISNVAALLESKGVAICRYEIEGERVDAFSFWNGSRPFIFMASEKEAGVRTRFDLAHELGHLVLHRWIEEAELADPRTLKNIELEADRFAGAFLLPAKSFPNEVYTARLDAFLDLKRRWGVSIQAMVYRCRDLEVIDEGQFTNLYKQISFRKWRKREPLDDPSIIKIEQPKMLKKAVQMILENSKKHPDEICTEIGLAPNLIAEFWNVPPELLAPTQPEGPILSLR